MQACKHSIKKSWDGKRRVVPGVLEGEYYKEIKVVYTYNVVIVTVIHVLRY